MIPNNFSMQVSCTKGLYCVQINYKEISVEGSHTNIKKAMYKAIDYLETAFEIDFETQTVKTR